MNSGTPVEYSYDDADKLLEITQGMATLREYTYDTAGRPTEITNIGGAGLATFTWDFEDRLASIEYSDGLMAWGEEFTYNGLGTRISKYDSTGYREYMRNGAGVTSPVLSDEDAVYTPGISERRSSATRYYHADLKNGVAQVNTSQAIAATKQYDAFGNETSSSGTWNGPFGYGGPFGYQSDPDSGLKLLGHRYYDSSTGRFLTRDKAKDGRNWYVYGENNPLSRADPDGQHTLIFDGRKVTLLDDSGNVIITTPGTSGRPGTGRADQGKPWVGPIPEGRYTINPDEVQASTWNPFTWPWPGRGYPPWDVPSWGNRKVPVISLNIKRGGFFLHGGYRMGSAGCIDVGFADVELIDSIAVVPHPVDVFVNYDGWTGKTPGSPWSARGGGPRSGSGGPVTPSRTPTFVHNWPVH